MKTRKNSRKCSSGRASRPRRPAPKIAKESFNGLTLHVIASPKKARATKRTGKARAPSPAGLDQRRQRLLRRQRRRDRQGPGCSSRGTREFARRTPKSFTKTLAKTDASKAQAIWYFDVAKVIKLVIKTQRQGQRRAGRANRRPGVRAGGLWPQVGRRLVSPGIG